MQAKIAEFERHAIHVSAVSVDALDDSNELAADLGLSFPLVVDTDLALTKAFGVDDPGNMIAWPAVFVIDRSGHIAWRWTATTYKQRPSVQELLTVVDALPPLTP